jgi:transposase
MSSGSVRASTPPRSATSSPPWKRSRDQLAAQRPHLLCATPADLRKSFDGLAALVRDGLGADPLSGHLFVFRNKAADRVKVLYWDRDGLAIWYKRLELGTFRFPAASKGDSVEIRAADLAMLLDGVDLSSVRRRQRYQRPQPV